MNNKIKASRGRWNKFCLKSKEEKWDELKIKLTTTSLSFLFSLSPNLELISQIIDNMKSPILNTLCTRCLELEKENCNLEKKLYNSDNELVKFQFTALSKDKTIKFLCTKIRMLNFQLICLKKN